MKTLAKFVGAALIGAFALLAAPARAQVGVSINLGAPAWGPPVAQGVQYYYIPEIDGYYDLYTQQYLVNQDGYWVPLPELYGYDPHQFHPVAIGYRGREPWLQGEYYHSHYAYRPYVPYGGRGGYFAGGYGRGYDARGYGNRGFDGRGYGRGYDRGGYDARGYGNRGGYDDHGRGGDFDRRGGFDNRGGNRDFDHRGGFDNRGQNPGGFNRGNQGPAPQPAPGGQGGRGGQGGFDQGPQGGGRGPGPQGNPEGFGGGGRGDGGGRRGH